VTIERALARAVQKPWGSLDLRPWTTTTPGDGVAVGELWYERAGDDESRSVLLLKLLVTKQQLSIQVHPDDAYAQSIGLSQGKTEAWYILSATPGAQVAVGLTTRISPQKLREAIDDGSIADLVHWRPVVQDDVIFVPAGTIHAIGPGLAIAEIQQRSDATFRMFDYGRGRELHVTDAIAVANAGPTEAASPPIRFTDYRTLLIADPHFVLERIDLPPSSHWSFQTERETWLLALRGGAQVGPFDLSIADAILIDGEQARIDAGNQGLKCLVAYPGPHPLSNLLRGVDDPPGDTANSRSRGLPSQPTSGAALPPIHQEPQP